MNESGQPFTFDHPYKLPRQSCSQQQASVHAHYSVIV